MNKQCYHCFFIDRLCRSLSIFRPGQDAKLIVFSLKYLKGFKKKIKKKKKNKQCYHCFFFYRSTMSINFYFPSRSRR